MKDRHGDPDRDFDRRACGRAFGRGNSRRRLRHDVFGDRQGRKLSAYPAAGKVADEFAGADADGGVKVKRVSVLKSVFRIFGDRKMKKWQSLKGGPCEAFGSSLAKVTSTSSRRILDFLAGSWRRSDR